MLEKDKEFSLLRVLIGIAFGILLIIFFVIGYLFSDFCQKDEIAEIKTIEEVALSHEAAIIQAVESVSPSVVSIVASKDVPIVERRLEVFEDDFGFEIRVPHYEEKGTREQEIGEGSGFIISSQGMVLTNRHVVDDKEANFTIFTNQGDKFDAEIIARDPVYDLAILQIISEDTQFTKVKLGDSSGIIIGQTAIAIGNALGEFRNTVSVGVISGLERTISAIEGDKRYVFEGVIQTDAAINRGNSGGPLLNLKGEVVGINTAMAIGAQNIGFSIPINEAKRAIESVINRGEIVYPFLGVRYLIIDDKIAQENDLEVNYGAWIIDGSAGEPAIEPGSAAESAGIRKDDIILEMNNQIINKDNSLAREILKYHPEDEVSLKILRDGQEIMKEVILGERR